MRLTELLDKHTIVMRKQDGMCIAETAKENDEVVSASAEQAEDALMLLMEKLGTSYEEPAGMDE